ncbi:Os02g0751201 [Oryza sativa Japonica Group]|uniref:Os02g0751201 protein n=1 Tax=Oryza sativa subsp. japonica TaxID=39947 RepID=A0A0P0VPM2_ORYSJ|nr:Os02g0751201 [Oryza sativa Japonica Group]
MRGSMVKEAMAMAMANARCEGTGEGCGGVERGTERKGEVCTVDVARWFCAGVVCCSRPKPGPQETACCKAARCTAALAKGDSSPISVITTGIRSFCVQ